MRSASYFVAIVLLGLVAAAFVPADPLVARARQLEKAGDSEGAARMLSAWLAANPGAPGSAVVFGAYLDQEQDLSDLFEESVKFLRTGKGVPGAARQFERIARLFDLAGHAEEARDAYMAANAEGASDSTLVAAFLLSLMMNDADAMSESLGKMSGKAESNTIFLRALSDVRAGDPAAARTALLGLAEQTGNPDLALKALWILYQAARSSGDSSGQAALRARLSSRFAAAPETALAGGGSADGTGPRATVVQMPAPGPFDARPATPKADAVPAPTLTLPTQAAPTEASPPVQPVLPSSPLMSVQAGSFLMKENADDLESELRKRGFNVVVIHEAAQGKDRYRVLPGTGLGQEAAKAVLRRLTDAGYRGFLVADK